MIWEFASGVSAKKIHLSFELWYFWHKHLKQYLFYFHLYWKASLWQNLELLQFRSLYRFFWTSLAAEKTLVFALFNYISPLEIQTTVNPVLTHYTLTSECIFSILFSIHFTRCKQEEFVQQSRASLVGDHFLYSHDLCVWFQKRYRREKLDTRHSEG